jgi:hypothetical protein
VPGSIGWGFRDRTALSAALAPIASPSIASTACAVASAKPSPPAPLITVVKVACVHGAQHTCPSVFARAISAARVS